MGEMKLPRIGLLPTDDEGYDFLLVAFNEEVEVWMGFDLGSAGPGIIRPEDQSRVIELAPPEAECPECGATIRARMAK